MSSFFRPSPPAIAAALSGLLVLAIPLFLLGFSLPLLEDGQWTALLSWHWRPLAGEFGILPMLAGSLLLSAPALLLALPLALGLCAFAHGVGPSWAARPLMALIRAMTSVPTVVYGLTSMFLLVPLLRRAFSGAGFSWLAALLTLALLVLPTIVLLLDSQFREVRESVQLTAAALGFDRAQTVLHLILPGSVRGLALAAVLGFGRAIGDTLLPLMLAGNAPLLPASPLDPLRTLTAHIALVVATDTQSAAYHSLFACGLLLFGVSLLVNLGVRRLLPSPAGRGAGGEGKRRSNCQAGFSLRRLFPSPRPSPEGRGGKTLAKPLPAGQLHEAMAEREKGEGGRGKSKTGRSLILHLKKAACDREKAVKPPWRTLLPSPFSLPCQALPPRGIWLGALAWASALLLPLLLAVLLGFLLREGAGALNLALFFGDTPPMAAIFRAAPDFDGIWPACLGTLCLVALATAMAVPLGLLAGVWLAEYARGRARAAFAFAVELLAGVPSIVMGLSGFALILLLRRSFAPAANTGLLLSAACLALLVLPALISATRLALENLPPELRLAGAALGFSRAQQLRHLLLPAAGPGIQSGIVLAIARAAEDTAVILLTGVVANAGTPASLTGKYEALPFHIYYLAAEYRHPAELAQAFATALVLMALTGLLFAAARRLQGRIGRRWRMG